VYSVDSLEYAIRGLYRSGIGENSGLSADEVEELLDGIDFHALLRAVRHHAETVFAFATQGNQPKSFNYRGAELFGQFIAAGYKNVRIDAAVLFQHSQQLFLTGEFRYLIVQLHDIQAPEQTAAACGLEVRQKLLQNGTALVLELVVHAEESILKFFFRDLSD